MFIVLFLWYVVFVQSLNIVSFTDESQHDVAYDVHPFKTLSACLSLGALVHTTKNKWYKSPNNPACIHWIDLSYCLRFTGR